MDDNQLKHYWTEGEGLAKWFTHAHPWTALYGHLRKHMPDEMAKRVAAEWYHEVLGRWPGEHKRSAGGAPMREVLRYDRTWALDDIAVRSTGDGRTVDAYAAVFAVAAEVRDQHGHYMEIIDRGAFRRTLNNNGPSKVHVLYNHGMTASGTPDMLGSVPLGTPLEIRPDGRGLRTVTRYNRSALADAVLEAIRAGDIRAQSFRGRIYRSTPERVPRARPGAALPTVTRLELGLTEFGPTPSAVYETAEILAVRSAVDIIDEIAQLDEEERDRLIPELARALSLPALVAVAQQPDDPDPPEPDAEPDADTATPAEPGSGAEDPPPAGHSGRLAIARAALRARMIMQGM